VRYFELERGLNVDELGYGDSPPNLGGVPARTAKREPDRAKPQKKSEQAGWFLCRYHPLS